MILFVSMLETEEERETMEAFYLRWLPKFMHAAYVYMHSEEDAHDMVIGALMRLMDKYQHYFEYAKRNEYMLMGLMLRFIEQECVEELGRRSKQVAGSACYEEYEEACAEAERAGSFVPGFEDDLVRVLSLRAALNKLPRRDRVLVAAYYILKYPRKEAGEYVGLGPEGVKSRLASILRRLKRELMEVACHE